MKQVTQNDIVTCINLSNLALQLLINSPLYCFVSRVQLRLVYVFNSIIFLKRRYFSPFLLSAMTDKIWFCFCHFLVLPVSLLKIFFHYFLFLYVHVCVIILITWKVYVFALVVFMYY